VSRLVEMVVQSARDLHPTFDEERHPTGPTYRELATICQELQNATISLLPEYSQLEVVTSFAIPFVADFADGLALPACRLVTDVVAVGPTQSDGALEFSVALINADGRFARNSPRMAAW